MTYKLRRMLSPLLGLLAIAVLSCHPSTAKKAEETTSTELDSLVESAHALIDTGFRSNYPYLIEYLTDLQNKCIAQNNKIMLGRVYLMRGSMERWRQNLLEGLNWCHKAYEEVKFTNTLTELDVLLEIGDIYRHLNKKRLANEFYLRAYDLAKNNANMVTQALVTNRLGAIFYAQHNYELALESFFQTLAIIKATNYEGEHNTKKMQLYNNIGLCYVQRGNYDTALKYYDSAIQNAMELPGSVQRVGYGVVTGNIGRLYQLKGEYELAVNKLKTNIEINSQPGADNGDAVTSYTYLLEIYNQVDSFAQFDKYITPAFELTNEVKQGRMKEWKARLLGLISANYAKKDNFKAAYYYQTLQADLQDSLRRLNDAENLQDLIMYRELVEKSELVNRLEEENESKETRLTTFIIVSVAVVVVMIIMVVFLYTYRNNLKKEKKLSAQIAFQNEQITLSKLDLEQAIEELKMMNSEKNRMLGMVAHDLRGPIYNITGVLQLLESSPDFAKLNKAEGQLLDLIQRSCDNALEVINDLLEAAQLDSNGLEMEKLNTNLADVIKSTIHLYENRAIQKQLQIVFNDPATPVLAPVSQEKLSRAIGNLLSNAIKFSHAKGKIHIVLSTVNKHALLSVADEGMGIPDELKDSIFDKFTRAKRQGTDGEKPVGLGMSIVKQIVEAHHGRIWFDSEVNNGTTFYIELPLA
jgi:two-component system, OmpR family, sensor histidine kinase VicK